jgi:hypothetical protein
LGYESSGEESSEVENILGGMNMDECMGEEPVSGEEGISVGGQSLDDDNGVVLEKTVGNSDPTAEPFFQSGTLSWMNLWVLTRTFLSGRSLRTPSIRRVLNCRAPLLPIYLKGTVRLFLLPLSFQYGRCYLSISFLLCGYRAPSWSPSPRRRDKQECYHCGEMGHLKSECPQYLESPKGEKRVSFQENKEALNYKRATREAWARPLFILPIPIFLQTHLFYPASPPL